MIDKIYDRAKFSIFSKLNLIDEIIQVTRGIIETSIDISMKNANSNMHKQRWSKKYDKPSLPGHTQRYIFFQTLLPFQLAYMICRFFV